MLCNECGFREVVRFKTCLRCRIAKEERKEKRYSLQPKDKCKRCSRPRLGLYKHCQKCLESYSARYVPKFGRHKRYGVPEKVSVRCMDFIRSSYR